MLELLELTEVKGKFPYQVSGGQKQRCACARAMVNHPKLLLADEPTGALDSRSAQILLETFTKLNQSMEETILMVTHDAFSASYCKRILFLRDGKIFHELVRGAKSRREFLQEILDVNCQMLGKLAFRNMKRSARDYLVYVLTMTLVTALVYAFSSLIFRKDFIKIDVWNDMMGTMVIVASVFVVLIAAWLIGYMVRFILEKEAVNLAFTFCWG